MRIDVLSDPVVSALGAGEHWDKQRPGLGIRVTAKGARVWIITVRGKVRTLGEWPNLPSEDAWLAGQRMRRDEVLAEVGLPIQQTTSIHAPLTIGELLERYLAHQKARRKPSTIANLRSCIDRWLKPAFLHVPLLDLDKPMVEAFHTGMAAKPVMANRAVEWMRGAWYWAEENRWVPPASNPARRIDKYREVPRKRVLSDDERLKLREGLLELRLRQPNAAAAIELLLITGARRGEVEKLKWSEVDWHKGVLNLGDSKTGPKTVAVSDRALDILRDVWNGSPDHKHPSVFPGLRVWRVWDRFRRGLELDGVTVHDLRRSWAEIAINEMRLDISTIAACLGQKTLRVTSEHYAHLRRETKRELVAGVGALVDSPNHVGQRTPAGGPPV